MALDFSNDVDIIDIVVPGETQIVEIAIPGFQGPQGNPGPPGSGAPDATTTSKGLIQIAGDLAGTAAAPTVPGLATKASLVHTHTASQISDSSAIGRTIIAAADATAVRTAIGAGTSSLTIGTTGTTAMAGNKTFTAADVGAATTAYVDAIGTSASTPNTVVRRGASGEASFSVVAVDAATQPWQATPKSYVDAIGTNAADANSIMRRDASGSTSATEVWISLTPTNVAQATRKDYVDAQVSTRAPTSHTHTIAQITATGTRDATTYLRGDGTWAVPAGGSGGSVTAANITDATTIGRTIITSADAAAVRTAIGAGTSSLQIGTTASTAAAGNDSRLSDARTPTAHTHTAANISDASTIGRTVLTAADATAVRTAIGAGTGSSNLALGTTNTTAKAGDYAPPIDGAAGTGTMRTLGTGSTQAAAGNHTHAGMVTGTGITEVRSMTQAAYDALGTKVATTLYVIVG